MVTLNMESRSPMGRVNAENRSKTQKPLGFKGLRWLPVVSIKEPMLTILTYKVKP